MSKKLSVSVCPLLALNFERLDLLRLFLVRRYTFGMSRSSSYIKVIGLRSRLQEQKACLYILLAGGLPSSERQSCSFDESMMMMMVMMMRMKRRHTEQSLYQMLELQEDTVHGRVADTIGGHPCNFKIVFKLSNVTTLTLSVWPINLIVMDMINTHQVAYCTAIIDML